MSAPLAAPTLGVPIGGNADFQGFEARRMRLFDLGTSSITTASGDTPTDGMIAYSSQTGAKRIKFYDAAGPGDVLVPRLDYQENVTVPWAFTQADGTNPFTVTSTTKVTNLNADRVDDYHASTSATASTVAARDSNARIKAADPSASDDVVTLGYLGSYVAGIRDPKDACRVATTANLVATRSSNTLTADANGALNDTGIDGVTDLAVNDRVMVKNQTTAKDRGLYIITDLGSGSTPWIMQRSSDADSSAEVTNGLSVWITAGTTNAQSGWLLTTADPITLNTTSLTFVQDNGAAQLTQGNGIDITGNTISVKVNGSTTYSANRVLFHAATSTLDSSANLTFVTSALTIGVAGAATGSLKLTGATSGTVTTSVAAAAGTWTLTLPTGGGTANYALITDGSGVSSWSILPVAGGGSGAGTLTGMLKGNGTSAFTAVTGTANTIVKWGTAGATLANSNITDDGTTVTVATASNGNILLSPNGTGLTIISSRAVIGATSNGMRDTNAGSDGPFELLVWDGSGSASAGFNLSSSSTSFYAMAFGVLNAAGNNVRRAGFESCDVDNTTGSETGGLAIITRTTSGVIAPWEFRSTGTLEAQGARTLQTSSGTLTIQGNAGTTSVGGHLIWATDNTYDIGASGATRARDLYLGRNAVVGGTLNVTGTTTLATALTGIATLAAGVVGRVLPGTTASMTVGTLPKFSASTPFLIDSIMTESASVITVTGGLTVTGTSTLATSLSGIIKAVSGVISADLPGTTSSETSGTIVKFSSGSPYLVDSIMTESGSTITIGGGITLTGANTFQTSTGQLDIKTAGGNGNIVLTPHGTGLTVIASRAVIGATSNGMRDTNAGSDGPFELLVWDGTSSSSAGFNLSSSSTSFYAMAFGVLNAAGNNVRRAGFEGCDVDNTTGSETGGLAVITRTTSGVIAPWEFRSTGTFEAQGARTIQTSSGVLTVTGTGGITITTASNTNAILNFGSGTTTVTTSAATISGTLSVGGNTMFGSITATAGAVLHVLSSGTAVGTLTATAATIQANTATSTNCYLSLVSGTIGISGIVFGNATDRANGRIYYNSNTDALGLMTAATDKLTITTSGVVNISQLTASMLVQTDASKNLVSSNTLPAATTIASVAIARKVSGTFASGAATYTITHSLSAQSIICRVYRVTTGQTWIIDYANTDSGGTPDSNKVTFSFGFTLADVGGGVSDYAYVITG